MHCHHYYMYHFIMRPLIFAFKFNCQYDLENVNLFLFKFPVLSISCFLWNYQQILLQIRIHVYNSFSRHLMIWNRNFLEQKIQKIFCLQWPKGLNTTQSVLTSKQSRGAAVRCHMFLCTQFFSKLKISAEYLNRSQHFR